MIRRGLQQMAHLGLRVFLKIHCGLRERGFESRMLVRRRVTNDKDVAPIRGRLSKIADKAAGFVTDSLGLQYVWFPF